MHRPEKNIGSGAVQFTADDLPVIEQAVIQVEIQGVRYSAQAQQAINRQDR